VSVTREEVRQGLLDGIVLTAPYVQHLLAALDDAERWKQAQRTARLWVEEGRWVIPASGNEGHTFTETIDTARAGGA
jgi:hypothetical protein